MPKKSASNQPNLVEKLSGKKRQQEATATIPPAKVTATETQVTSTTQELLQKLDATEKQVGQLTTIIERLASQLQTTQALVLEQNLQLTHVVRLIDQLSSLTGPLFSFAVLTTSLIANMPSPTYSSDDSNDSQNDTPPTTPAFKTAAKKL